MTSISGSMSAVQMMSPNDRMQIALQSAVAAGTVKSADQSALSSALTDIDTAMKSSGPPTAGTDPSQMKTRIDGLIDQEVKDGKLTDDQATELKKVFSDASPSMQAIGGTDGTQGAGGAHRGAMHHHHHSSSSSSSDASSTTSTDTTGTTSTTDSSKSAVEQLVSFLKQLEQSMTATSPYSATGSSTASATSSSLLINSAA